MENARIEIRIKNNILYKLIYSNYESVKHFCGENNLTYNVVIDLINISKNSKPFWFNKNNIQIYSKTATKISSALKLPMDYIFPDELYSIKKNKIVMESEITSIQHNAVLKQIEQNPENKVMEDSLSEEIEIIFDGLSEQEVIVLKGIFYENLTLEKMSEKMGISRERVRQIRKKAIRKLRHPSRSNGLKEYFYR